jgi:hypothetical protein
MHADNAALAAEYQQYLGEAEKWFRHAKEDTHAGVNTKSARGVATGYSGEPYGPLAVFNEWADRQFAKQLAPGYFDAANLADRAAFDVWQAEMVRDIRAHWSKKRAPEMRGRTRQIEFPPLPFLQASRLANSFIKALRVKCNKRPHVLEAIFANGHVVLNAPTLSVLRELYTNLSEYDLLQSEDEVQQSYRSIQQRARDFCTEYGGSPLLFDVFARNKRSDLEGKDLASRSFQVRRSRAQAYHLTF